MTNEEIITDYMREHYSDQALASLLAHSEDGNLSFFSCTCFIGVPPAIAAGSALHGVCGHGRGHKHPLFASVAREEIPEADAAEDAFYRLGRNDAERRAAIIPLIRAEIARRDSLSEQSLVVETEAICAVR